MAVSDSREVIIEAGPAEILDVIADVPATPTWSPQYLKGEVLSTYEDGRPRQARMVIKAAGLTDTLVTEYRWTDTSCSWSLVSGGQIRAQDATYTLTPEGDKTRVRFELSVDPIVPLPGFILKRALKGGMETATDGLRKQVLKLKKQ